MFKSWFEWFRFYISKSSRFVSEQAKEQSKPERLALSEGSILAEESIG